MRGAGPGGEWDYLCGHCGATVAKRVEKDTIGAGMIVQCWKCQRFGEVPVDPAIHPRLKVDQSQSTESRSIEGSARPHHGHPSRSIAGSGPSLK